MCMYSLQLLSSRASLDLVMQLLSSRASLDLVTLIAKCTMCKFAAIFGQLVGNEISLLALLSEFKISLAELSTSL